MAAPALAQGVDAYDRPAPISLVRWLIAVVGCAAAIGAVRLAHASDQLSEPVLQAVLLNWITVPYILAGLIAWSRRPESRFGPLMIAAGFAMFLSSLQWSDATVPYTVGLAFDLVPAALLLHLFLAFPSGKLSRMPELPLVAAAYFSAVGLQLVKMLLGGGEDRNVLGVVAGSGATQALEDVQLVSLSVFSLAGIGVLVVRRRTSVAPLRRRIALLVNSFAIALVALAVLLLAGAFGWPAFETIRRVTFVLIGLTPVAFLIGLLNARLSRPPLTGLLVKLRANPPPADLREALAGALGDPSLTLAYWLPEYGSWVDVDGATVEWPSEVSGRGTTLIDQDGS